MLLMLPQHQKLLSMKPRTKHGRYYLLCCCSSEVRHFFIAQLLQFIALKDAKISEMQVAAENHVAASARLADETAKIQHDLMLSRQQLQQTSIALAFAQVAVLSLL
jgi:hypothetical protein